MFLTVRSQQEGHENNGLVSDTFCAREPAVSPRIRGLRNGATKAHGPIGHIVVKLDKPRSALKTTNHGTAPRN